MFLKPGIIKDLPARVELLEKHLLGMEIPLLNYHPGLFHTLLDQNQQAKTACRSSQSPSESNPGTLSCLGSSDLEGNIYQEVFACLMVKHVRNMF